MVDCPHSPAGAAPFQLIARDLTCRGYRLNWTCSHGFQAAWPPGSVPAAIPALCMQDTGEMARVQVLFLMRLIAPTGPSPLHTLITTWHEASATSILYCHADHLVLQSVYRFPYNEHRFNLFLALLVEDLRRLSSADIMHAHLATGAFASQQNVSPLGAWKI